MAKAGRRILSPAVVKAVDGILQSQHENSERLKQDVQRNDALLTPDGSVDVTNREAQQGRRLPRAVLVSRIRKLNPNLWYEQSIQYPNKGGLYIQDVLSPFGKRMVCAFPHETVNEFSLRITVPEIIPTAGLAPVWKTIQRVDQHEPGWRAVLLKLIIEGLIEPSGVEREFKISQGRSSQKWQQAVN